MDNISILLVEDCHLTASKISSELQRVGYHVVVVDMAESAIEAVKKDQPDLILMDVNLKGEMTGLEATKIIKKAFDIPILILSASVDESFIDRAISSGADNYLAKTSSFQEINILIMMAIKQHKHKIEEDAQEKEKLTRSLVLAETNMRMILALQAFDKIREEEKRLLDGHSINEFYEVVVQELVRLTGAEYGALVLFDEKGEALEFIAVGMSEQQKTDIGVVPKGHGMLKSVYESDDVVRLDNLGEEQRYKGLPGKHPAIHSLLGSAITVNKTRRAAIYLANKKHSEQVYSDSDELVLRLFIPEIEHTLERSELVSQINRDRTVLRKQRDAQQELNIKIGKMRDQLVQSEKMASIGQLAAGVAHEINNPIGYVSSNFVTLKKYIADIFSVMDEMEKCKAESVELELVRQSVIARMEQVEFDYVRQDISELLSESNEGIERVRKIVQDLKDFSHVDETEWQWADINQGITSTLNIVNNEIKYKAKVVKELGDIPEIECMASQLNQVFMNLMVNAAHAIEEKGVIRIRTGRLDDSTVFVEVADNGKGISQENINNIFNPFFTTKPVGKGTGLGLSLSYSIIEKHNGKIEVRSKEGVGTKFTLYLPVQQTDINQEEGYKNGTTQS